MLFWQNNFLSKQEKGCFLTEQKCPHMQAAGDSRALENPNQKQLLSRVKTSIFFKSMQLIRSHRVQSYNTYGTRSSPNLKLLSSCHLQQQKEFKAPIQAPNYARQLLQAKKITCSCRCSRFNISRELSSRSWDSQNLDTRCRIQSEGQLLLSGSKHVPMQRKIIYVIYIIHI